MRIIGMGCGDGNENIVAGGKLFFIDHVIGSSPPLFVFALKM